jgi:hypothetical protein
VDGFPVPGALELGFRLDVGLRDDGLLVGIVEVGLEEVGFDEGVDDVGFDTALIHTREL